jgi:RHS repeat-associated protein
MMSIRKLFLSASLVTLCANGILWGQTTLETVISAPKGAPTIPVRNGYFNVYTGSLHLEIPITSTPQRGMGPQGEKLVYDSGGFWFSNSQFPGDNPVISPQENETFWHLSYFSGLPSVGSVTPENVDDISCGGGWYGAIEIYNFWEFTDPSGTSHLFTPGTTNTQNCASATGTPEYPNGYGNLTATGFATDGSGYYISITNGDEPQIFYPDGTSSTTPNGNGLYYSVNSNVGTTTCNNTWGSYAQPYVAAPSATCQMTYQGFNGSSSKSTYTLVWEYIPVCTAFDANLSAPIQAYDYCGGIWAIESITLPDRVSTYSFQYDTGTVPGHYGQMTSMTLPTGGTVGYSYFPPTGNGASDPSDGRGDVKSITDHAGVTAFSRTFSTYTNVYDLAAPQFLTETITYPSHIIDPLKPTVLASDETVFTTAQLPPVGNVTPTTMTQQDYLNGALTKTTSWDTTVVGIPSFVQTTWNQTGSTDKIQYTYALGDVVSRADEYVNGSLYRTKEIQYQQDTSAIKYVSQFHMVNYPVSTQVLDGNGIVVAQESRTYDEYGASYCNVTPPGVATIPMLTNITGALAHDDTDDGASRSARGNPTTITTGTTTGSMATVHMCYDTLGNVTEAVDANGKPTAFSNVDDYSDTNCITSSSPTYTFTTTITDALGHQTKKAYNSCLGAVKQSQDANDLAAKRSGTQQTYDLDGRPLCTTFADGGSNCIGYSPTSANTMTQTVLLSASQSHTVTTTLGSFGDIASIVDNSSDSEIDETYDTAGRLSTVSNAYTVGSTAPVTTFAYDGFGRMLAQLQADGTSELLWTYTGTTVDTYDEVKVHKQLQKDALGRLLKVFELGTAAAPLNYETDYSYDVLNNLLQVDEWGGPNSTSGERQRTFTYDSLSQLVCASNPENSSNSCPKVEPATGTSGLPANTVRYTYDANGNVVNKTDARGLTITYKYDALNRMIDKNSSDGAINYAYYYDGSDGNSETNPLGRLTFASNQVNAAESYFYDPMGRVLKSTYCVPQDCKYDIAASAIYDLAGDLTQLTYPDGRVVTQGYNGAGQLSSVNFASFSGNSVNSKYLTVPTPGGYDAAGHLINATMGNGVQITSAYNNRETIGSLGYALGSQNLWSKQYTWYANENLKLITDGISGVQREFTYDNLNRLQSAQDLAGTSGGTGEVAAISVEAEDNTLQSSQQLGGPGWGASNATPTPNAAAAPDGSLTAAVVTANGGSTDSYVDDAVANPSLYDGAAFTGSVWLRVPSGTLATHLYLVEDGDQGFSVVAQTAVTLTTTWQRFTVGGTLQNGLIYVILQIGGGGTILGGQVFDVWGPEMGPTAAGGMVMNILPSSEQVTGPSWLTELATVTGNAVPAPDGTNTAQTITANAGSADSYFLDYVQNPSQYSRQVVTASVYLRVASGTANLALFIINYGSSGYSVANSEIVTLNTSWQRFDLTATNQAALTTEYFQIGGAATLTSGHSVSVWGAQMVMGFSPDGYVETQNTTTVTGTSQTLAANGLNEAYSYDAFGNIQETGTYSFVQGYTASNQLSGWSYDQAGNLLTDGLGNSYQYDAEGKTKSGAGATYVYTAEGQRVEKAGSSTVDTVYFGGRPIARLVAGTGWTDLVYGSGGLLLEVPGTQTGSPTYRMTDHLGSLVGTLSSAGAVVGTQDLAPFGEVFAGQAIDPFVFTGKERDTESGNDYFGARYYSSNMGRFLSPDPSGLTYASATNPQSLNLYSYALNNPLTNIDPTGMYCFYGGAGDTPENDSDPTDFDFSATSASECGSGGQYIDNPSTTVTVSTGGDNGNTLSTFPSSTSANFQFIPGRGCSAALHTAGANSSAINNYYNRYQTPINNAANAKGMDPRYLAAIGVRESGLPANPDVVQANGNGRGIFQIDLGAHPGVTVAQAFDPGYSANYAASLLVANAATLADKYNLNDPQGTQATAASYNFGTGNISGNPNTIDVGTTGGNYGSNVVAIAGNCL